MEGLMGSDLVVHRLELFSWPLKFFAFLFKSFDFILVPLNSVLELDVVQSSIERWHSEWVWLGRRCHNNWVSSLVPSFGGTGFKQHQSQ